MARKHSGVKGLCILFKWFYIVFILNCTAYCKILTKSKRCVGKLSFIKYYERWKGIICTYFSLELGKSYFLHIPIIDNDGDQFQCALSTYLEADDFGSFLTDLVKANALSIDKYVSNKIIFFTHHDKWVSLFLKHLIF